MRPSCSCLVARRRQRRQCSSCSAAATPWQRTAHATSPPTSTHAPSSCSSSRCSWRQVQQQRRKRKGRSSRWHAGASRPCPVRSPCHWALWTVHTL
jgi:hypothetical protein